MCKERVYIAKKVFLEYILPYEENMEDLTQILQWYVLSGVDDICDEVPLCVVGAEKQNETQKKAEKIIRPATTLLAQSNNEACNNARDVCALAQTLDDLKSIMENFEGCSLKFSANSTVFGYGNPHAEVMIIGEAPGADEDIAGEPFVGRCGKLLSKMLSAIGIEREDCFITNVLPWRPPGNRTPTDGEVAVCLPFLKRQIELVKPKIILLLGGSSAKAVLNTEERISNIRGRIIEYVSDSGERFATISSYHPAYLLRSPQYKANAWGDFLRLQKKLREKES